MSYVLLVEENRELAEMYKTVVEGLNYQVVHYSNYEDLYKHLDGEGFSAVILDAKSVEDSLEFISKIRKDAPIQIPIFAILDAETEPHKFLNYGNVKCLSRFPDSGNLIGELTRKLSPHSQFKNLLHHKYKIN